LIKESGIVLNQLKKKMRSNFQYFLPKCPHKNEENWFQSFQHIVQSEPTCWCNIFKKMIATSITNKKFFEKRAIFERGILGEKVDYSLK